MTIRPPQRGVLTTLMIFSVASSTVAIEPACPHPAIRPVVEVSDLLGDPSQAPPGVGQPMGDNVCELYCGITVVDPQAWIPACSSYECAFTLQAPDGTTQRRTIEFGPRFDGMEKPTSTGTVCIAWSESLPPGWYKASLECADSPAPARFNVLVERSHELGFDLPASLWRGANRCPSRPSVGETPNPSLRRTPHGRALERSRVRHLWLRSAAWPGGGR